MVSADLERPDLRAYFMTHPAKGLTNALLRERNAVDSLEHVAEGLYLLDVGPDAAIASELLGSPVMGEVLEELEAECDMVLIDSAALLESADALSLAPLADATVLVVDAARVAVSDISQSRTMLERVGVHPVGAVLNNASRSQHRTAATRPEPPQLPAGASWSA
jgi:Mrp family chromosome partitioning ATPase